MCAMLRSALSITLTILVLLVTASLGVLVEKFDDLGRNEFDFIIVGGGTAGNTIANRLTENPDHNVLVLEAGGTNKDILISMVPGLCNSTIGSEIDWYYIAQGGPVVNRDIVVPRGFVLGGSSSINCMIYTRGTRDDWDRYADVTGDEGWSWDSIQPYIRKNEHFTPPVDGHNTTGEFDLAVHGFNGINSVTLSGFRHQVNTRVIQASKSMANDSDYRFILDMNSGDHLGVGFGQSTVFNGSRSSSATSYLGEQFINRPNLSVLLHAHVTHILPINPGGDLLSSKSVEFSQDFGDTVHVLNASKEVILSAGSIASPQILMNSGIGDTSTLEPLGIKTLLHSPSVGRNLSEHAIVVVPWAVTATDTQSEAIRNKTLAEEQLRQWNETRTGPLADGPGWDIGWIRLSDNASVFERFKDPSAGPNTGHLEMEFVNDGHGAIIEDPLPNLVGSNPILMCPTSRGLVTLNTSNPFDHPIINFNFLDSEFDLFALREGIRSVRRFMTSPMFDGFIVSTPVNMTTDEELEEYIKAKVTGALHPVGTVMMTAKGSDWGVVDPDLRVKGVEGLRVVDSSIFPFVPAAHTQAPTYIVAERGADLIKASWAQRG